MRPGEIFALEWIGRDFRRMRIRVSRRLYGGEIDTPKSNKPRLIALTPPARNALLTLPRSGALAFRSRHGCRLSEPALSGHRGKVRAAAGLDFDLATKHYCAHYLLVKLGLPDRVVKEQLGHVDAKLLRTVYGHGDIGPLEGIDAAFGHNVRQLRAVSDPVDGEF
jgi:integrase